MQLHAKVLRRHHGDVRCLRGQEQEVHEQFSDANRRQKDGRRQRRGQGKRRKTVEILAHIERKHALASALNGLDIKIGLEHTPFVVLVDFFPHLNMQKNPADYGPQQH